MTRVAHALLAPHSAAQPEWDEVRLERPSLEPNMPEAYDALLRLQAAARVHEDTPGGIEPVQAVRMALELLSAPKAASVLAEVLASGYVPPWRRPRSAVSPLNPMPPPSCQPMQKSPTTPAAPLEEPMPSRGPQIDRVQVPPPPAPPGGEGYYTRGYWEWKTNDGGFWKWLRGDLARPILLTDI